MYTFRTGFADQGRQVHPEFDVANRALTVNRSRGGRKAVRLGAASTMGSTFLVNAVSLLVPIQATTLKLFMDKICAVVKGKGNWAVLRTENPRAGYARRSGRRMEVKGSVLVSGGLGCRWRILVPGWHTGKR